MNSYQLISKLRKVRGDTYLSTASQALYHELVAICNDMKWKEVFSSVVACFVLIWIYLIILCVNQGKVLLALSSYTIKPARIDV